MMIKITNYIFSKITEWVVALQHVYTYMDVGGRATQEQLPSSPVCPPGYVKKLQSPSLDFALQASVALRHCSKFAPGNFVTKGAAISSFFHYAIQANTTAWTQEVERIQETESRTTLHAVQLRILGLYVQLPKGKIVACVTRHSYHIARGLLFGN